MAFLLISVATVRLLGVAIALSIGGIASLRAWRLRRASQSWPMVEGKILSGRAKGISNGSGAVIWYAEMTYTFTTLNGDYYAGRFDHHTANEAQANEYVRQMKDAKVSIRYRPGDPDTSLAMLV